jgi:hypothetical protein
MLDNDSFDTSRVAPQHPKKGFTGTVDSFSANREVTSYVKYPHLIIARNGCSEFSDSDLHSVIPRGIARAHIRDEKGNICALKMFPR